MFVSLQDSLQVTHRTKIWVFEQGGKYEHQLKIVTEVISPYYHQDKKATRDVVIVQQAHVTRLEEILLPRMLS